MSGFTLINVGAAANDGNGDSLRVSQQAVNTNYTSTPRIVGSTAALASETAASGYVRIVNTIYSGGLFVAVNGGAPDGGDVFASATVGWTWQRLKSSIRNARDYGCLGENETGWSASANTTAFQAFFDALALTGGIGIIPDTYGGGDYVCDDHPKFENKVPPSPIIIQCAGILRLNAIGAAGTVLLIRNSTDIFWIGGTIDGGSGEGVLGNNAIGISGISENGGQRSSNIHFLGVTMRDCVMDPFLKGGKGWSIQSGANDCGFSKCLIENCDLGFGYESTFDDEGDRVAARGYFTDSVIKNCKYAGAWLHQGSGYSGDPAFYSLRLANLTFDNCGDPVGITWGSGDLASSVITKTDHGFYSRDSVRMTKGATIPTGLVDDTRYYVLKLDANRFQLVSSASRVVNQPNTSISSGSDWVNAIGHQFLTGESLKYLAGTAAVGGLTNETIYYIVRNAYNYFQLTATSANISTFESGDTNLGTNEITITSHPFSTGSAVKLSIGTPSSATVINSQMEFELSGGSAFSGSVRPGTTLNNDEYLPQTTYYVISVDANTVKLARSSAEASAGTAINITTAGAGTMGLCLASNIVDITSQGTGYQTFGVPITISDGGTGTHTLRPDGWAPIIWDRAEYVTASNIQFINRSSARKQTVCWGRCANVTLNATAAVNDLENLWNFGVHGNRGEFGDAGSVPSVNNTIDIDLTIDRELYSITANTDGSTGVITGIISADLARVAVGDSVTVSAGFATAGPFEVTAKSSTANSLTVDASSNSSQTGVTVARVSSVTTPLITGSSTSGVQLRQSNIKVTVAGYADSIDIANPIGTTVRYQFERTETGEVLTGVGQTTAGSNPRFSTTRTRQFQKLPLVIGDFYFSDDGTYANLRTVNSKLLALCDSGGIRVARCTTSGLQVESSAWNGRRLLLGSYHIWVDSSGNMRSKSSDPANETDGVIISANPIT